jgi:hypothetical protein
MSILNMGWDEKERQRKINDIGNAWKEKENSRNKVIYSIWLTMYDNITQLIA